MIPQPTLICIPDISGFTKFMSETESELNSKVIPSLLNKIIYSNEIGLKVSEIEGDAVLFYRHGNLPSLKELLEQCLTFYSEFYKQIDLLRKQHEHNKDSSKIPELLGLKIILHFGHEVDSVQIGSRIKLMGEDVIIAHRLLKNKIKHKEYLLLSENLLSQYSEEDILETFKNHQIKADGNYYKHLGEINYSYIDVSTLI